MHQCEGQRKDNCVKVNLYVFKSFSKDVISDSLRAR